MRRSARWVVLVCACSVLSLARVNAGEMSHLNLSPGFPTSLDDAYPVNDGSVVFQPTFRFDKSDDRDYLRARQTMDLRWGVSKGLELFVGGTGIRGPELPGTMDDPKAVRGGLLYRLSRQSDLGGVGPSLAVRTTVQVPVSSSQTDPALRTDLLASWDLSEGWWGHINAGYQIAPGGQPGLQAPGRNSVWYGRIGFVKALGSSFGLIVSGTFSQDYTRSVGRLVTPEVGLTYAIRPDWIVMVGAGGDFGNSPQRASERGTVGMAWVF